MQLLRFRPKASDAFRPGLLERATFRIGVAKASTKYTLFGMGFIVVAIASWRVARSERRR